MIEGWKHLRFWRKAWPDVRSNIENYNGITLPHRRDLFKALELTPYDKVKCVILGQDPYPTAGHAMGLAFSVLPHVRPIPRSLANIQREYMDDLGYPRPRTGDLTPWAQEGVLLLNSVLTVETGSPNSHAGIGWEKLTYEILTSLRDRVEVVEGVLRSNSPVFVLWGRSAQEYKGALRGSRLVCSAHPSPLSASKGFFGSRPFSKVNELLGKGNEINWRLP